MAPSVEGSTVSLVSMDGSAKQLRLPSFSKGILIIVGGYGSGKSEVAVNLSRHLATTQSEPVTIADLDIVNPYFRSREAAARLEKLGIRALVPAGDQYYAENPILIPEVKGAIERNEGKLLLDVGGDDVGSRVLGSLTDSFVEGSYELLLTLNANRPFTADVDGCLKMIREIEDASRLKLTGIVSNTHLLENTSLETVLDGLELARRVSDETNLPVVFLSALAEIVESMDADAIDIPVLPLTRLLLKPWEKEAADGE